MLLTYTASLTRCHVLGAMGVLLFRPRVYKTGLLHTNPARPPEHTVKKAVAARRLCLIVLVPCEKQHYWTSAFRGRSICKNINAKILLGGKCVVPPQQAYSVSSPALVCAAAERYKCNSDQLSLARRKLAHLWVYLNELQSEMLSIRYL